MAEYGPAFSSVQARLAALRARIREEGVDGFLVSQAENRTYLSGFTGSAGWLLISKDTALLATDSRYYEQVLRQCPDYELVKVPLRFIDVLPDMLARAAVHRVAFEADAVSYADAQKWFECAADYEWVPSTDWVTTLRSVKDDGELRVLRAAISLADEALAFALNQVRPGMSERDLAWVIESYMRTHGAQAVAFPTIVACGPNSALPHAMPSEAPLEVGQPIMIDMGARVDGYCSDLTRTVCLGEPADPERFWQVYGTVLKAQQAAEAALQPGITGEQADKIARSVIAEAGYGDCFGHGLGHGVGLAVHEGPRLSRTNPDPLLAGSLVTVEPGIYLPGWGGVRIEDIALITQDGVEIITAMPKEPIIPLD